MQRVAVNQRQIVNHALVFDFAEHGAGGVYLGHVTGDFHDLGGLADFQTDVETAILV